MLYLELWGFGSERSVGGTSQYIQIELAASVTWDKGLPKADPSLDCYPGEEVSLFWLGGSPSPSVILSLLAAKGR
jgi:hypothetical protein